MNPEALRQHIDMALLRKGVTNLAMKGYIRITAMWAYNEGLKARASVHPTCADLGGCDEEEHS